MERHDAWKLQLHTTARSCSMSTLTYWKCPISHCQVPKVTKDTLKGCCPECWQWPKKSSETKIEAVGFGAPKSRSKFWQKLLGRAVVDQPSSFLPKSSKNACEKMPNNSYTLYTGYRSPSHGPVIFIMHCWVPIDTARCLSNSKWARCGWAFSERARNEPERIQKSDLQLSFFQWFFNWQLLKKSRLLLFPFFSWQFNWAIEPPVSLRLAAWWWPWRAAIERSRRLGQRALRACHLARNWDTVTDTFMIHFFDIFGCHTVRENDLQFVLHFLCLTYTVFNYLCIHPGKDPFWVSKHQTYYVLFLLRPLSYIHILFPKTVWNI